MTHFHVGANMPGYLPETDPYCTDSAGHAWQCFQGDLTHVLDGIDDDGEFLDIDTRRNTMTAFDLTRDGELSIMVGHVRYWAVAVEGSTDTCDLWEDA